MLCLDERLQFAHFLGQNGAQIAYPQPSPQGNLYETHLNETHLWIAYCMEVAPGRTKHPRQWTDDFVRNWGQTIGMLHRLARLYPSWQASIDPASGEEFLTWSEEWQSFHDWIQDDEVKCRWLEIGEHLRTLPITREVFGFIHNDPHSWNLLVDGNRITLLDFDVANHHWFVNDIAIACQSTLFTRSGGFDRPVYNRQRLHSFLTTFLEGYRRQYHLSPEWLKHLDIFIAYRRILLFTVMVEGIQSRSGVYASWKQTILDQPNVILPYAGSQSQSRATD
jgi:Ser/Thr protein kinase RdoA (MazF antagonist)